MSNIRNIAMPVVSMPRVLGFALGMCILGYNLHSQVIATGQPLEHPLWAIIAMSAIVAFVGALVWSLKQYAACGAKFYLTVVLVMVAMMVYVFQPYHFPPLRIEVLDWLVPPRLSKTEMVFGSLGAVGIGLVLLTFWPTKRASSKLEAV